MSDKIKFLKIQLSLGIFILITLLLSGFFVFGPSLQEVVMALTGNYSKSTGDSLTIADWNNLDDDFLDKSGDTMSGDLNMSNHRITNLPDPIAPGDVATKQYVDNNSGTPGGTPFDGDMGGNPITNLGNPVNDTDAVNLLTLNNKITNTSGETLRLVCGKEFITEANTVQYTSTILHVTIDTSSAGFNGSGLYFTSISGYGSHYKIFGENAIYDTSHSSFSVSDGFDLYLRFYDYNHANGDQVSIADAVNWNWAINWCGVGF